MSPRTRLGCVVLMLLVAFSLSAMAQDTSASKVDLFAGYAWAHPGQEGFIRPGDLARGFDVAGTLWGGRYAGITLDAGASFGDKARVGTIMAGPSFRLPSEHISPFAHFLIGGNFFDPKGFQNDNGIGLGMGGGFDWRLTDKFDWRMFQADLLYAHHHCGAHCNYELIGPRLATGIVMKFGTVGPPPVPPSAACSANPTEVYAGEPVTVTANPSNFNPKRTLTYNWSGTNGVKVTGNNTTASVDTNGLQAGQYSVRANITDGKKGMADCTANFTVKQPQPPTISCSANPSTVRPGDSSTITSQASSPENRKLTYSYQASAGSISGNDASATLSTAGAQPGPINVTCNVADDRNLSANSTTNVTVEAPPPPPPPPAKPMASKLNDINFKRNNARVDNAAKAILDDVALRLQRDADSKAVIVGNTEGKESKKLAAQRAANARNYLVNEKGIDASRIDLRTGSDSSMTDAIWIVPAGATFDEAGTTPVTAPVKKAMKKSGAKKKAAPKKM